MTEQSEVLTGFSPAYEIAATLTPREIVNELDKHIVGQQDAKRAVAIALRNRWRRMKLSDDLRETAALTLGGEMNFAQAGEILGVAEGTIAWRMSEIKKRLKTLASKDSGLGQEALA